MRLGRLLYAVPIHDQVTDGARRHDERGLASAATPGHAPKNVPQGPQIAKKGQPEEACAAECARPRRHGRIRPANCDTWRRGYFLKMTQLWDQGT